MNIYFSFKIWRYDFIFMSLKNLGTFYNLILLSEMNFK